jgi:hypothetical protein
LGLGSASASSRYSGEVQGKGGTGTGTASVADIRNQMQGARGLWMAFKTLVKDAEPQGESQKRTLFRGVEPQALCHVCADSSRCGHFRPVQPVMQGN